MTNPDSARVAIVTGGAAGIGAGITRRLLADGWQVVVADWNGQALEQFAPCQYGEVRMHHVANRASRRLSGFNDIARASPRRM